MPDFKLKNCYRNTVLFGITVLMILTADLLTLFGNIFFEPASVLLFAANVVLNFSIIIDLLHHIRRDFPLLVFVGTFDILLLGRVYVSFFGHYSQILYFLEAENFQNLFIALKVVTLSLFCVYAFYRFFSPLFYKREKALEQKGTAACAKSPLTPIVRQISVVILLISSMAFFYTLGLSILNVLRSGYLKSFTQVNENSIPTAISRLSMFFVPSFAVFLATLPNKKQMKLPMFVYAVYMLASVFTGRRNTFVVEVLMLIIYFVLRDSMMEKEKRKLKKPTVLLGGAAAVVAMYLLQLFAEIRTGYYTFNKSFLQLFINFFHSQGASFRVVVQTVNQWDHFDHGASFHFLFYPFELFVHNNVVTRTLFGLQPIIEVQTMTFVQTTHNFAHVLTYMVDRSRYLAGGGFGTSFVAEAYVAYGIFGVIAYSALVGLIFRFFASMMTRNWVVIASCLIAIKNFVYIPRSFAFLWVTDVFNITYLVFYIALYLIALFILKAGTHVRPADEAGRGSPLLEEKT